MLRECGRRSVFERFKSGALDDGGVVAGEAVLGEKFSDFHFDEFEKFGIVDLIASCS